MDQANNFWGFLEALVNKLPGWPSERQVVMITTFAMGFMMIIMGRNDASLWNVELFKTLITVVIVTGCVNMILAFHFAANKLDENRSNNTKAAFEAITATANNNGNSTETDSSAIHEGDEVTFEKK